MGSLVEINDTLQLTREQGFPAELNLDTHLQKPLVAADFKGKTFTFHDKPKIRIYQQAPVRCFLVENREGKWIYWGLVHVLSLELDYLKQTTSGTYRIIYINTPEEMEKVFNLTDRNASNNYFKS